MLRDGATDWQVNGEAIVDRELTDRILRQGNALACAIEALGTIEPINRLERNLAGLPLYLYKRPLRAIVAAAPDWVAEEILSASERIGDDRAVLWTSEN